MSDDDPIDPAADTSSFQAFQNAPEPTERQPQTFRVLTLIGGLVVFAALVYFLLLG